MKCFVDFDELIYLNFDHSPGYTQWHVMINLGQAMKEGSNSIILQRFGKREDAEKFKEDIRYSCIKVKAAIIEEG